MLDKVLRFLITSFLAVLFAALLYPARHILTEYIGEEMAGVTMGILEITVTGLLCIVVGALVGGIIGYFSSSYLIRQLKRFSSWVEAQLSKMSAVEIAVGAVGLALGLVIANLLSYSFGKIPAVGDFLPVVFSIVFGYLGIHIATKRRKDILAAMEAVPRSFKEIRTSKDKDSKEKSNQPANFCYKLLDTSVIIDGRIADICLTGFIEGTLLIPVFVLEELQHIADSPDALKRVRGRRGLDILQKIRTEPTLDVEITNVDYEDIPEVDSKLVRLAQDVKGKIITNDFNLNKVAQLRGVAVLNINDLSNAVKPVVIPGESMEVKVVKDGKEPGQGVAYLDDGTMIVVENGRRHMNEKVRVEVTSALQTSAGRMIFARPR